MRLRFRAAPVNWFHPLKVRRATPEQIRKAAGLSKKDQARVDKLVKDELEKCKHRNKRTLVSGDYECGASTSYMIRPALYWCTSCGAYAYEIADPVHSVEKMKWHSPSRSKKR